MTENVLNTFFSTIISDLYICEYSLFDSISCDIDDPVLNHIVKYIDHASTKATKNISTQLFSLFKGKY